MKNLKKELQQTFEGEQISDTIKLYAEQLIDRIVEKGNEVIIEKCSFCIWDGGFYFEILHNGHDIGIEMEHGKESIELYVLCDDSSEREKVLKLNNHTIISAYAWLRNCIGA